VFGAIAGLRVRISCGLRIGYVNRSLAKDGTSGDKPCPQGQRTGRGNRPMVGNDGEEVAVHLMYHCIIGVAKACRARATASNTRWRSVCELEISRKISAVAACCSRPSASSRLSSSTD
jgi:hypothetical protein